MSGRCNLIVPCSRKQARLTALLPPCGPGDSEAVRDDSVVDHDVASTDPVAAYSGLLEQCAVGRKLGVTRMEHIAMVPAALRVGDAVALLYGAATPMVLREMECLDGSAPGDGRWELVGECYVHEVMDGEALKGLTLSEIFRIW